MSKRKVIRIMRVSEVQNNIGRRVLLVASCPIFLLYSIAAVTVMAALYMALVVLVSAPLAIIRHARILIHSARLRWHHAKPKGADDWACTAVDAYVDRLDERTAIAWTWAQKDEHP